MKRSSAITTTGLALLAAGATLSSKSDAAETLQIESQSVSVQSVTTAAALQRLSANKAFCNLWPDGKKVLNWLKDALSEPPPWGPLYKLVIAILIALGDKACPPKT